jgi:hypothetical protein
MLSHYCEFTLTHLFLSARRSSLLLQGIMCTSCCNGIVYADSCCQVNPNTARPNDDYCQLLTGKKIRKACLCKCGKVLLNEPYKRDGSHSGNHSHTWTQEVTCFLGATERFPTFEFHSCSRKILNITAMSKVSDHLRMSELNHTRYFISNVGKLTGPLFFLIALYRDHFHNFNVNLFTRNFEARM